MILLTGPDDPERARIGALLQGANLECQGTALEDSQRVLREKNVKLILFCAAAADAVTISALSSVCQWRGARSCPVVLVAEDVPDDVVLQVVHAGADGSMLRRRGAGYVVGHAEAMLRLGRRPAQDAVAEVRRGPAAPLAELPASSPLAPIARASAWKAASELVRNTAGKFLTVPTSLIAARATDTGLASGCQIVMGAATNQLEMRVAIASDSKSVKQLAMHVFGDDADDVGAELLPELTNMFMGALKSAFSAESIGFAAGLPEAITPARVLQPANAYTLEQSFELQVVDARVLVHLGLRSVANATVAIAGLREGMVLAKDVFNAKGLMLVSSGTRLSFNMIERMRAMLAPKQPVEVLGS